MCDETFSQLQHIQVVQYGLNDVHTNARVLQDYKLHDNTSKQINVGPFTTLWLTIHKQETRQSQETRFSYDDLSIFSKLARILQVTIYLVSLQSACFAKPAKPPQGFLSSGDGYNRQFDAILSTFEHKERCVDDTIHYDSDLEQHWWRTIGLLTQVGQAGIVMNPDKFQFANKSVNFAGFRVSDSSIEPLPKYLDAFMDFPSPTCTTDIRSWFGLVSHTACVMSWQYLSPSSAPTINSVGLMN